MKRIHFERSPIFNFGVLLAENEVTGYLCFGLYLLKYRFEVDIKKLHDGY